MRLRGVDPKIHRKRQKKAVEKLVCVEDNVGSVAFDHLLPAVKDMRRLLHTILVGAASGVRCSCLRGASCLSGFRNTKLLLSVGGVFRRVFGRAVLRKSSAFSTAANTGTKKDL